MTALGQLLETTAPVPFDEAAAGAAARQLELTAQSIGEALAVLRTDLAVVRKGWQGPHRHHFDAEAARMLVTGAFHAQLLSDLAVAVRAKSMEAAAVRRAAVEAAHNDGSH